MGSDGRRPSTSKTLPLVHPGEVGYHTVAVSDDTVEEPAGVDGGELFRITHQDDLAVALFRVEDEPGNRRARIQVGTTDVTVVIDDDSQTVITLWVE